MCVRVSVGCGGVCVAVVGWIGEWGVSHGSILDEILRQSAHLLISTSVPHFGLF